jgi:hypothetical protein
LAFFVMKRNSVRCQREKSVQDIGLRAASDADAKIFDLKLDQVLDEVEDPLAWWHYAGGIRTLVQSIYDKINSWLLWEWQHVLQAIEKYSAIRQARSIIVGRVEVGKDIVARVWPSAELHKKGW